MGRDENYTTRNGVRMTDPQVQVQWFFLGYSTAWMRQIGWTKEEFHEHLAPFFFGGDNTSDWGRGS